MSELKATTVYDAYWNANSTGQGTGVQVYLKSEADKVIAEKEFLIKMMRRHIYELKLADAIEKMNFWNEQKLWWDSLKDKVATQPLFDYAIKAETWTNRVEKYKAKIKELKETDK